MPFRAVLGVINVLLALAGFLVIGVLSLMNGEELLWVVIKAVGTFLVCWFVLGYFSNLLANASDKYVFEKEDDADEEPAKGK